MDRKEIFENAPVHKAVFSMALPTILSMIVIILYNMADTFFVGGRSLTIRRLWHEDTDSTADGRTDSGTYVYRYKHDSGNGKSSGFLCA